MKYTRVKAVTCALTASVMLFGSATQINATSVDLDLPAAGVGLVLEESSSLSSVQEEAVQSEKAAEAVAEVQSSPEVTPADIESGLTGVGESMIDAKVADHVQEQQMEAAISGGVGVASVLSVSTESEQPAAASESSMDSLAIAAAETNMVTATVSPAVDSGSPKLIVEPVNLKETQEIKEENGRGEAEASAQTKEDKQQNTDNKESNKAESDRKSESASESESGKSTSDQKNESTGGNTSDQKSESASENTSGQKNESASENTSDQESESTSVSTSNQESESASESTSNQESESASESSSNQESESASENASGQESESQSESSAESESSSQPTTETEASSEVSTEGAAGDEGQMTETTAQTEAAQTESQAGTVSAQSTATVTGGTTGSDVVDFAVQFVGNPYKYGGTSLTNGADCSGFVMSVYENFGVSLPHSSSGDRNVGTDVGGLENAQPGDLVCYSGHVGIYIGDNQIVHASTAKTGIKISDADYRTPLAVRRVLN